MRLTAHRTRSCRLNFTPRSRTKGRLRSERASYSAAVSSKVPLTSRGRLISNPSPVFRFSGVPVFRRSGAFSGAAGDAGLGGFRMVGMCSMGEPSDGVSSAFGSKSAIRGVFIGNEGVGKHVVGDGPRVLRLQHRHWGLLVVGAGEQGRVG